MHAQKNCTAWCWRGFLDALWYHITIYLLHHILNFRIQTTNANLIKSYFNTKKTKDYTCLTDRILQRDQLLHAQLLELKDNLMLFRNMYNCSCIYIVNYSQTFYFGNSNGHPYFYVYHALTYVLWIKLNLE